MGFKNGAYAKVWQVEQISDKNTKLRISISKKDKRTGEYEQCFSGFVNCIGETAAKSALHLQEGARIQLGDVDVETKYDGVKKVTYTNFYVYSFDNAEGPSHAPSSKTDRADEGYVDESRLPF